MKTSASDASLFPPRETLSLDGLWDFRFFEGAALETADPGLDVYDDLMPVPASFDATPRYRMKRGLAMHRVRFTLAKAWPNARLRVGACGLRGRAWIDGREVGSIPMGWNELAAETGPLAAGTHTLVVATDNRLRGAVPFFQPNYDFYGWGGVYRSVSLERLPRGSSLDRVQVRTLDAARREVELRFVFRGRVADGKKVGARLAFDTDRTPRTLALTVRGGAATARLRVPLGRLWSPDSPTLHTLRAAVPGGPAVEETFGIRTFEARDGAFWLNGERIRLVGFNRHESHPELGATVPEAVMLEDLHHLRTLGCNFIRGAHYPQDPRFLALCDRLGFLVWEEALAWGNNAAQLADPVFADGQEAQVRRMVRASVNHPCVAIWGFLNECESSSDAGVALVRRLVEACHEEDPSRPATFACNHGASDRAVPYCDIAAYNTYPGWIGPDGLDQPEDGIVADRDRLVAHFRRSAKPGAPIMISETGICGVYGAHDEAGAQWTEEFQARWLAAAVDAALSCPDIAGLAVWHLTDATSYHRVGGTLRTKPFAMNLAGVYDCRRRPKLAAAAFARVVREHTTP